MNDLLFVVDKQSWHVGVDSPLLARHGRGDVDVAMKTADELVWAARTNGVPVWWTQNIEGTIPVEWPLLPGEELTVDDPLYAIHGVGPEPGEVVLAKQFPASMAADDPAWLHPAMVAADRIVVVGAFAGRCVLSTATNLVAGGKKVVFVEDAVAAHPGSPAELDVTVAVVRSTLGWVESAANVALTWKRDHVRRP